MITTVDTRIDYRPENFVGDVPDGKELTDFWTGVRTYFDPDKITGKGKHLIYFDGTGVKTAPGTGLSWIKYLCDKGWYIHYHCYHGVAELATPGGPFLYVKNTAGLGTRWRPQHFVQTTRRALYVDATLSAIDSKFPNDGLVVAGHSGGAWALTAYLNYTQGFPVTQSEAFQRKIKGYHINGLGVSKSAGDNHWLHYAYGAATLGYLATGLPKTGPKILLSWGGADRYTAMELRRGWLRGINSPIVYPFCPSTASVHTWMKQTADTPEWERLLSQLHSGVALSDKNGNALVAMDRINKGIKS